MAVLICFKSYRDLPESQHNSTFTEISSNWFYFRQKINGKLYELIGSIDFKPVFILKKIAGIKRNSENQSQKRISNEIAIQNQLKIYLIADETKNLTQESLNTFFVVEKLKIQFFSMK